LKGELVHPTQLYSILWLMLVGILLLTLWNNDMSSAFIFGLYLILTGLGRFVEEAYRGEVQTPRIKGLRLYQWTAVFSVIAGIFMTIIQVEPAVIHPGFGWESVLVAALSGFFLFFAMGVDFPFSNARFSRLV
jgi:prolipoprotein diacylglyceryltransferase